jgi:hypothetical protein
MNEGDIVKYDVFIAYYRKTGIDFAKDLKEGLKDLEYSAFLDLCDIPRSVKDGSDEWRVRRDKALLKSDKMLLIMTEGFNTRPEVLHEIELAMDKGIRIIYFKHEDLPYDVELIIKGKKINLSKYALNSFDNSPDLLRRSLVILKKPHSSIVVESIFDDMVDEYIKSEGAFIRNSPSPMIEIIIGSTNKIVDWLPPNEENKAIVRASRYCVGNIVPRRYYYECGTLREEFFRVHVNGYFHLLTLIETRREGYVPIDDLIYRILEMLIYCIRVMKRKDIDTNQSIYIKFRNVRDIKLKFHPWGWSVFNFASDELEPYIKQFNSGEEWSAFKKLFNTIYRELCTDLGYPTITDLIINQRLWKIIRDMSEIRTTYQSAKIPDVELEEFGFTTEEMNVR